MAIAEDGRLADGAEMFSPAGGFDAVVDLAPAPMPREDVDGKPVVKVVGLQKTTDFALS